MSEPRITGRLAKAAIRCQVGCLLLVTLSLTIFPQAWVNVGLGLALLLGVLAAGLSPTQAGPESGC